MTRQSRYARRHGGRKSSCAAAAVVCAAWALLSPWGWGPAEPRAGATPPPAPQPPVVVIDPGHGGANLGAMGRKGHEKQVTLQVALLLRKGLQARGYRVVLTREDDRYLTLRERVRRANAAQPAVFLSLHANASPDHSQRGIETYVLDRGVAEVEARRAARRAGGPVTALLADLRQSDLLRQSMRLGRAVQDNLISLRQADDRGVKQGDYDVLAGVAAPAVLVELGFVDHVVDGPLLYEPTVQRQLAQAIGDGVQTYLDNAGLAGPGRR